MTTPKVLVPLAPGFEEIEAITVIDILRRAGIEVITAAVPANAERPGSDAAGTKPEQNLDKKNITGEFTEENPVAKNAAETKPACRAEASAKAETKPEHIVASRGTRHIADCALDDVNADDFDMIVLPGGQPGANNLRADPRIRRIIENLQRRDKRIAAICAAPGILAAYGALDGRVATSHPSARDGVAARVARYSEKRVVVDGPVVTSRSAGTAMEFAFKLVEILCGPEKAAEVNRGVLARL